MDFHGTFNKLIISKGSGSHLPACRLWRSHPMTQLSDLPSAGLPPWRWFPCLHRDPAFAPPGAVGRSGASSGPWKNLSEIVDTKRPWFPSTLMHFQKKTLNLLQHHSSPASLPAWRFLQKENATFARFYRSSKFSTWISSAFLSIK